MVNKVVIIHGDEMLSLSLSKAFKDDFIIIAEKNLSLVTEEKLKNTDLIIGDKKLLLKNLAELKSVLMKKSATSRMPLLVIGDTIEYSDIEGFIDFDIKDFITLPLNETELIYRAKSLIIYKNIFEKYNQSLIISGSLIDNLEDHIRDIEKYNNQIAEEKEKFKTSIRDRVKYYSDLLEKLKPGFSTLLGNCQVLSKGLAGELKDDQIKLLDVIEKSAKNLVDLVSDNIRFSEIETGKARLFLNKVNVAFLFEVTIKKMLFYLNSRGISVETICPKGLPEVEVDIEKIVEVIQGLISSFSVYFSKNCKITLEAKEPDGNFITVSIAYTGKNIDIKKLEEELLKYNTLYPTSGYGYPLWMCEEITELHHGNISLEQPEKNKTTYSFKLPVDFIIGDAEHIS